MDKYEYKLRSEEIKSLIAERDFVKAIEIADSIDWSRVRSVSMLCTISDLYKVNRRYKEAKDILTLAYERNSYGRTILYSLCELCIKTDDIVHAIEHYKEFVKLAPTDNGKFVLQYKIYEAQDVSLEERIAVLEELKKRDYREKWGYELAYLYHRIGLTTKCVEECDELIVWFGEGRYIKKAMELKMLHQPLTEQQEVLYKNMLPENEKKQFEDQTKVYDGKELEAAIQNEMGQTKVFDGTDGFDIKVKTVDVGKYNTINLQEALAESMKEVLVADDNFQTRYQENQEAENEEVESEEVENKEASEDVNIVETEEGNLSEEIPENTAETELSESDVVEETEETFEEEISGTEEAENTEVEINEKATISKDIVELTVEEDPKAGSVTEAIMEPMLRDLELYQDDDNEKLKNLQAVTIDGSAVNEKEEIAEEEIAEEVNTVEESKFADEEVKGSEKVNFSTMEMAQINPPKNMGHLLSQEYNGQISMVVPDEEKIEKQITGQICLEDVLKEWEKTKKENEEKRKKETSARVLAQTGTLFTAFEERIRDGILEKLEKGEIDISSIKDHSSSVIADEVKEALKEEKEVLLNNKEESDQEESEVLEKTEAENILEDPEAMEEFSDDDGVEELTEIEDEVVDEEAEELEAESNMEEEVINTASDMEKQEVQSESEEQEDESEIEDEVEDETEVQLESEEEEETEEQKNVNQKEERILSEEEIELFAPFVQTKSARLRLMKALDEISLAAYTGNIFVTGETHEETAELAKNVIREVQLTDRNFSGKVAKVTGVSLNDRDIDAMVTRLSNGGLIIEKASGMDVQTVKDLLKALNQEKSGIVVVLEDNKKARHRMMSDYSELKNIFNVHIEVEELSDDALVAYGKKYANHLEYSIDELGVLALHTRIDRMQTADHIVTVADVRDIIDEAIENASRKSLKHFTDVLFAKRYDDDDMIILREKDFLE